MPIVQVLTPWSKTESTNEMAVALDYPASWSDVTGQLDQDIADGLDLLVVQGEVSEEQLAAIRTDARYPVISAGDVEQKPNDLTEPEVEALQARLVEIVHPDIAKSITKDKLNPVDIADALIEAVLHKPWRPNTDAKIGEVYLFERNLYEVLQDHKTQADWRPDRVPALFKRRYEPTDDPWPWVQPLGAHDRYRTGSRVLHKGSIWVSRNDANVWEPGSVGAEALWTRESIVEPEPDVIPDWVSGEQLTFNASVPLYRMHLGKKYQLRQNPGVNIWTPPTVPALWLEVP